MQMLFEKRCNIKVGTSLKIPVHGSLITVLSDSTDLGIS
jgi:hypothetical protein